MQGESSRRLSFPAFVSFSFSSSSLPSKRTERRRTDFLPSFPSSSSFPRSFIPQPPVPQRPSSSSPLPSPSSPPPPTPSPATSLPSNPLAFNLPPSCSSGTSRSGTITDSTPSPLRLLLQREGRRTCRWRRSKLLCWLLEERRLERRRRRGRRLLSRLRVERLERRRRRRRARRVRRRRRWWLLEFCSVSESDGWVSRVVGVGESLW
ncbi:hypothetical protein BDY24DRAFT_194741 [Mrakia frigida]|uniref:uncharacterized protein n=1 Tax=Mrakia frigida TaxID=29902 RepID=UPI003FCC0CD1